MPCVVLWVCAVVIGLFASASLHAEEPPPAAPAPEISKAVAELTAADFSRRQAAEQRLLALGPPAFEPLVALLGNVPSEAGQRILHILEQTWLQTPEPESDILERQLETLRLTPGPFQLDVTRLLFAHHRLREERAVRSLRRLNALVKTVVDENAFELQARLGQPFVNMPERISQIILPRSWKGTEADLWHIQRLAHLKTLTVFVVRGNGISDAARRNMPVGFPDLHVDERSEVFLGVLSSPFPTESDRIGCQITGIQPDSPAEIANLEVGDLIQSVDGKRIKNFDGLVQALKTKHGYETMELQVQRYGEDRPLLVTVIGLPWEARRFERPPPPPLAQTLYQDQSQPLILPPAEPN